jgi:hypothetical protein
MSKHALEALAIYSLLVVGANAQVSTPPPIVPPADTTRARIVSTPSALHGTVSTEMHGRNRPFVNGAPKLNTTVPNSVGIGINSQ